MLSELKRQVLSANLALPAQGLVLFTWGNVSGIDRESGLVVIKPSGVEYGELTEDKLVVVDLDGRVVEGEYRPSSDTPTHLALYRAFPNLGGIVHTHSTFATAFAQAQRPIRPLGTTHADYFYGDVPCTRALSEAEVEDDYEENTGKVIIEALKGLDTDATAGVLAANHGPFTWGKSPEEAVYHATVLEETAKMAYLTEQLNPKAELVAPYLLDKHFSRKHGSNAYYGQKS